MLLIRNITHIIKYEKQKNEGKYQELLTGTMSHEMLTPLNTIINLSNIVDLKLHRVSD
jgi:signal transduction histidine kinase